MSSTAITRASGDPSGSEWLRVEIAGCKPARFPLARKGSRAYRWLEVRLHNTSREPVRPPVGEHAVLVDTVGYAYRDRAPLRSRRRIPPGGTRKISYLFRLPEETVVGKLRLSQESHDHHIESGFVTLALPPAEPPPRQLNS